MLLCSCSYIPFINDCEHLPKILSYDGLILHFGRAPDDTQFAKSDDRVGYTKYVTYKWETCEGQTSLMLIHKRVYRPNGYGMMINVENAVYAGLQHGGVND